MSKFLAIALSLSALVLSAQGTKKTATPPPAPAAKTAPAPTPAATGFIANKNSKVFHKADCKLVAKMKPENKVPYASRDEAIKAGYKPCKVCNP